LLGNPWFQPWPTENPGLVGKVGSSRSTLWTRSPRLRRLAVRSAGAQFVRGAWTSCAGPLVSGSARGRCRVRSGPAGRSSASSFVPAAVPRAEEKSSLVRQSLSHAQTALSSAQLLTCKIASDRPAIHKDPMASGVPRTHLLPMKFASSTAKRPEFIASGQSVQNAARRMRDRGLTFLPVCKQDGLVVGLVTERDIVIHVVAAGRAPELCVVDEIMSRNPFSAQYQPGEKEGDSAMRSSRSAQRASVAIDEAGRLVAIVGQSIDDPVIMLHGPAATILRPPPSAREVASRGRQPSDCPIARVDGADNSSDDPERNLQLLVVPLETGERADDDQLGGAAAGTGGQGACPVAQADEPVSGRSGPAWAEIVRAE
jgi:CBS domain-containing protein